MSYRTYHPARGDIVNLNFSPSAGHELADRHYALVLSTLAYSKKTSMAIVCGITSRARGWPFEIPVPAGLLPDKKNVGAVQSVVLSDGVRQIDYRERGATFVAVAPEELVESVLDRLLAALEDD